MFGGFGSASKDRNIPGAMTSLCLIGGVDCLPGLTPDLKVLGGAIIKKTLCVRGNTELKNVLMDGDAIICGNLLVKENLSVYEKTVTGELGVLENTIMFGNLEVLGKTTLNELCVTGNSLVSGDITFTGNVYGIDVGGGVESWSGGTTGLTPSTPTTGNVVLSGTLNTSNGGTGLSVIGTSDQILGVNGAGTGLEYKDDLNLTGGATFEGNVIAGNADILGKLTVKDFCATDIARFGDDITVEGDIIVQGNIMAPFINIQGNCILTNDGLAKVCVYDGDVVEIDGDVTLNDTVTINSTLRTIGNVQFDQNLNVDGKLTANELCVTNNIDIDGSGDIGGDLTVVGNTTTGNADVLGKLTVNELCITNNGDITSNLDVGDTVTTYDLCVTNDAFFKGNVIISGNLSAGVSSFSAGTTGLTPSSPTIGDVVLDGTLNTSSGGTGLSTIGTSNQILGVNMAGTGLEYKDDIDLTGGATFGGNVEAGNVNVVGKLTAGDLCVTNDGDITGNLNVEEKLTAGDLCVTNDGDITGNLNVGEKLTAGDLCVTNDGDITGNLNVEEKLTAGDLCVTNDGDITGNLNVGEKLTAGDLCVTNDGDITGNLNVEEKLTAGDLCVTNDGDITGNLNVGNTTTTYELCVINDAIFKGNVTISGNLSAGVSSWSAGTTGLTPSSPTIGDVVLDGTLNTSSGGTGLSTIGTSNQILGVNMAGTGLEYKDDIDLTGGATFGGNVEAGNVNVVGKLTAGDLCVTNDGDITGNLNVEEKLTAGDLCVTNDGDITGNLNVGEKLTAGDLCVTNHGDITGNLNVEEKLTAGDLCVANDGDITGNLNVGNTTTTYDLCVTNDAIFKGNVTISGNLSAGVSSWSAGTTGLTPSSPTIGDVVLDGTLNEVSGGTGKAMYAVGDILYADSTTTLDTLNAGSLGDVLTLSGGVPTWAAPAASGVSTFQTSLDGLTPSTATSGAVTLAGTLGEISGGTGQTSYAEGDLLYASGVNTLSKLVAGDNGNVLTLDGGVPTWSAPVWVDTATSNLDMDCFEISNVSALFVSNIYPSDECGDATTVTINGNVDVLGNLCVEEDATFKSKVNINDRLAGNTVQEFWYVNTPGLNQAGPKQLYRHDIPTDTTTTIGGVSVQEISFYNNVLYGLRVNGEIYSINQSTAVETLEYQMDVQGSFLSSFSISPSGKFYGCYATNSRIYVFDPATSITTYLGLVGVDGDPRLFGSGSCFFKNDLYATLADGGITSIIRINLSNPLYSDIVVQTVGANKISNSLFTLEIDNEYRLYGCDKALGANTIGEVDLNTGMTINSFPFLPISNFVWSATSRSQYTPVLCLDGDVDLSDNDIYNVKHIEGNTINFVDGQITRKLTTNDICAYGNVEMNCNNIRNVGHLYVGNIHGKSPIDVWDDFNILNGNLITFEQGVLIGSNVTAGISSGVAVGKGATASGTYSTAIGSGPGAFLGAQATYTNSIAIGRQSNSTGPGSVSIGVGCISTGQQGIGMGVGAQARQNNSIAIGTSANCPTGGANNLGIAIGFQANSQGNQGIAIGYMANTVNPQGIAIGESASNGAFFGVAIGKDAVTTGQSSVAIGRQTKAGGNFTISIGYNSLYSSTGNYNIAIGRNTLSSVTTGISNISIGENGGNTATTGSFNTVIGSRSDVTGIAASGQTAIGHEAVCQADNSVAIGHYAGTGTVGIGSFHTVLLNIGMNVAVHQNATTGELTRATSSIRYKENVKPLDSAINKIFDMNPVTFNYKPEHSTDKESHLGFIAEEMNEIYPEAVYKDSEGNPEGIHYETLTSVLIKALQEAVQNIKSLEQRVSSLEGNE